MTERGGSQHRGRLVYDVDEASTSEVLDGEKDGIEYFALATPVTHFAMDGNGGFTMLSCLLHPALLLMEVAQVGEHDGCGHQQHDAGIFPTPGKLLAPETEGREAQQHSWSLLLTRYNFVFGRHHV